MYSLAFRGKYYSNASVHMPRSKQKTNGQALDDSEQNFNLQIFHFYSEWDYTLNIRHLFRSYS